MKKIFVSFSVMVITALMLFGMTAYSANRRMVNYYDENGNKIVIAGMYYNSQGYPMYNANCYYLDENGEAVYVGGCRVYYYDADGNLTAGRYYYNDDGFCVSRPSSYPGGFGLGSFCYNALGAAVTGSYFYDDFGNPVETPNAYVRTNHRCCNNMR